jgi:cold shock protein
MYGRRPAFFRTDDSPLAGRRVEATVKWFDAVKGFGFVTLADGGGEAFLPMATLRRVGRDDIREGASITCEIGAGAKGPLVVNVIHIDNSTATPATGGGRPAASPRPARTLDGMVKWVETEKGFGFIAPTGGGKDIFVHRTALERSGVPALVAGQKVRVAIVDGRRGLEADRITLI